MRAKMILAAAMLLSLAVTSVSFAAAMPSDIKTNKVLDGKTTVLTDANGMTLYTFDNDKTADKSSCNDRCAMAWPPAAAAASAKDIGDFKVITRDDGSKQWAWKGKPLYTFSRDMKPGDANGNDVGPNGTHIWHCAVVS
jgi:predicted lipoprotein with Yx(FWY)xxD motif